MRRRSFLLASFAWCVLADTRQEVYDLFATMASGLSEGNAEQFLRAFDPAMPAAAHHARVGESRRTLAGNAQLSDRSTVTRPITS